MPAAAQAFVLGYLCHLCVDEVSKHMWRHDVWMQLKPIHPGASFAALDEAARQRIQNYPAIHDVFCSIHPVNVIPRIPLADLEGILRGTCNFVQAENTEAGFLALVDMVDRPTPEQRREKQNLFRAEIDMARRHVHVFQLDTLVQAAIMHSRQRLNDLFEGRVPEPDYPPVVGVNLV